MAVNGPEEDFAPAVEELEGLIFHHHGSCGGSHRRISFDGAVDGRPDVWNRLPELYSGDGPLGDALRCKLEFLTQD